MMWRHVEFLDAFKVVSDRGRRIKQKEYLAEGPLAVVDQGEALVGGYTDDVASAIDADGPLIIFGDHTRRVKYVDFDFAVGADGVKVLKPSVDLDPKFAFWFLQSVHLPDRGYGRHFALLRDRRIPIPTLDVQRRIVDLLEDHLSRLDAADAAVSRSIQRLAALRDSKLSVAVERARESPFVEMRTMGELAKVSSGMTPLKGNRSFYDGGTIPWITSGDLHQGSITKATHFVTQTALDETTLKVVPAGTLLIAMYGEGRTRGTAAELRIAATINQACAAVQLHDPALGAWIRLVLDANYSVLRRLAAGGVQPNLNLSIVRGIEIPIPDSRVRENLLAQRDELDEANKRLLLELAVARRRAANLRHALLDAAFSGGLTDAFDLSAVEETLPV